MPQKSDMAGFPKSPAYPSTQFLAHSEGVLVSLSGSYSAYSQLTTPQYSLTGLMLSLYPWTSNVVQASLALGQPGSEVDFIAEYYTASQSYAGLAHTTFIPIWIDAGTPISWRAKGSGNCTIRITPVISNNDYHTAFDNYTASAALSGSGTSAWTQITAATLNSTRSLLYSIAVGGTGNYDGYLQIGAGSAGNEQVIVNGIGCDVRSNGPAPVQKFGLEFPLAIPAQTRLAYRSVYTANSAGTSYIGLHLGR